MIKKEESNSVIAYDTKPENNVRDYKQSHGNVKEIEAGDFLHQIRTKVSLVPHSHFIYKLYSRIHQHPFES